MCRESLTVRAAALEEMLEETRAERGQLENYKQLARETEAAKARTITHLFCDRSSWRLHMDTRPALACHLHIASRLF